MAARDSSAKQSLASLEYLQSQRRASITTEPSRHALKFSSNSSGPSSPTSRSRMLDPRPSSPYVFGDASTSQQEHGSQLRKLLHSPSEHPPHRPSSYDSTRNFTGTPTR